MIVTDLRVSPARPAAEPATPLAPQEVVRCAFLAARRVVPDDAARDVAQECWVKFRGQALREGPAWPAGRARAWLHRVATNASLELRRKAAPAPLEREPEQRDDPAERVAEQEEVARWGALFWEVYRELPREKRDLLVLRVVEGQDWAAIGRILDESAGTLRTRFTRLRREVKDAIESRRELKP